MGQVMQRDGATGCLAGAGAEVDLTVLRVGVVQAIDVLHAPCRRDGVGQRPCVAIVDADVQGRCAVAGNPIRLEGGVGVDALIEVSVVREAVARGRRHAAKLYQLLPPWVEGFCFQAVSVR